jgi:lysozyme
MKTLPDPSLPWPIPLKAVALIAEFEGLRLKAYRCPAGIWTIGWGETDGVRPGDRCTKEEADRWLLEDLTERAKLVREACTVEPSSDELGAFVSLAYNIGMGWDPRKPKPPGAKKGFRQSTVLKQHNAGNRQAASRAFGLWNKATVEGVLQDVDGLTRRRARESALYLQTDDEVPARMPQAVEAESKLTQSPINKGGIAAAGTGVIAVVTQAGESLATMSDPLRKVRELFLDQLGISPDWFLPLVMIGVGGAIIYWRHKQRTEGWA